MAGLAGTALVVAAAQVLVPTSASAGGRPAVTVSPEPSWTANLTIPLGFEIAQMVSVGKTVFAAEDWGTGRLALINTSTGNVKTVVTGVQGISLVTNGSRLWLFGNDSSIYEDLTLAEVSTKDGSTIRRAKVCPGTSPPDYGPINIAVTDTGIELLCKAGLLVEIDPDTLQIKRTLDLGIPWLTGVTDVNGILWIGTYSNGVVRVDRSTFTLLPGSLPECSEAWSVWSYGSRVVCEGLSSTVVYDADTLAPVSVLATPPTAYYATRTGGGVLVSGYNGPVSMVDPATATIAWTHATGGERTGAGIFYNKSLWIGIKGTLYRYPPAKK